MKKYFYLISIIVVALNSFYHPVFAENYPPTEDNMANFIILKERIKAPEVSFLDEKGVQISLNKFKDDVILVNFWASWCAPCIREMPSLDQLQAEMEGKKFQVVAVNQDIKGMAKAKPLLRDKLNLYNLSIYIDKNLKLGRKLNIQGLPTSFFIDKKGFIVGYYTGPLEWNTFAVKNFIAYLINE